MAKEKLKFYDVVSKEPIMTSDYSLRRTSNNRLQAVADYKGRKLYIFLKG